MEPGKKQIVYTAKDIQQYLSGNLTAAEMHAIEKAALEDPFLAEAMEGYEATRTKNSEQELAFLNTQFAPNAAGKVIPLKTARSFSSLKIAAAALVLLGGIGITYLFTTTNTQENKTLAKAGTRQDTSVKTTPENKTDTIASIANAPTNATIPAAPVIVPPVVRKEQQVIRDSQFLYKPENLAKKDSKPTSGGGYVPDLQSNQAEVTSSNEVMLAREKKEEQLIANNASAEQSKLQNLKKERQAVLRNFAAQVVGPDNSPLPFANVSVVNEQVGTYADARGNFRLVSSDSIINVQVKSAGYLPRNIVLKSNLAQNKIVLDEDNIELKEKTMVAGKAVAASKNKRAALMPDSVINVEPADGWSNYNTYITNNLSIPDDIRQKQVHGEVEVSFEVESNGAITNMKVDKSLCQDCDEAVLKVIKEGPRWKVKKGKKATAKVKVKF